MNILVPKYENNLYINREITNKMSKTVFIRNKHAQKGVHFWYE